MGFWRTSSGIDPNIEKNLTGGALSPCCGLTFAPGEVAFGPYSGPAVARWTAPTTGPFDISATFTTIQTVNASPNAYLYFAATQLFNQTTTAFGVSYSGVVNILAGQTIDVVVWGNNTNNKTTQVRATISRAVPEPATLSLLGLGLVGLGATLRARRK